MEKEIIEKFGKNTIGSGKSANKDIEFEEVTLSDGSKCSNFYTYKGRVCILNDQGWDNNFSFYSNKDQLLIYNSIMK